MKGLASVCCLHRTGPSACATPVFMRELQLTPIRQACWLLGVRSRYVINLISDQCTVPPILPGWYARQSRTRMGNLRLLSRRP